MYDKKSTKFKNLYKKEVINMANMVLVETSARHLHLSQSTIETLFGAGHQLTKKKDLSQPGQYACEEKVEVVGPKGSLKMSVLGPARNADQVEISLTDARSIGVVAPVRESGDIAGSGACLLRGPMGEVEIAQGVIAAKRHIHLTPEKTNRLLIIVGLQETHIAVGQDADELSVFMANRHT